MKRAVVIAGASGAGKSSIANALIMLDSRYELARSATTREPRLDGNDAEYIYYSREEFSKLVFADGFVEYTDYGGNLYGTPISELERIYSSGKIPIMILDLVGVKTLSEKEFDFCPVFLYVFEDLNTVERRLYKRELSVPTPERLESFLRRKEANIRDYARMPEIEHMFSAFIRNSELDIASEKLCAYLSESDITEDGIVITGEAKKQMAEQLRASALVKSES